LRTQIRLNCKANGAIQLSDGAGNFVDDTSLALVNPNVANTYLTAPALNMNLINAYPAVLPAIDALQVQRRLRNVPGAITPFIWGNPFLLHNLPSNPNNNINKVAMFV
jgi:hypothetical protein